MWQVATHHRNEENPEVLGRFLGRLQEQDPSNGQLDGPEVKLIQDGLHQAFDQSLGQWWGDSWGYPRDSGLIFWTAWVQGFIFQTKPSSYIIGVEKKHDCPRKDEIVRCVRNHKPGFCSQILGPGNQQRSTQETNAKVVVAQKINLAFWSMLIHFWGTAPNGECVCQRNFAVFYRGNLKWLCLLKFMTFFLPAEIHKVTWFLGGSARKSILFCCDLLPNLWGCQGKG